MDEWKHTQAQQQRRISEKGGEGWTMTGQMVGWKYTQTQQEYMQARRADGRRMDEMGGQTRKT